MLAGTVAHAADYSPPPPPPVIYQPPPVIEEFSSWYLRGDIGMTNQSVSSLTNIQDVNNSVRDVGIGFDSSPLFGLGLGYYFNDWLRFDVTGEYRAKSNFKGLQIIRSGGSLYTDEYSGSKSEWLFLANAYVDLGTWYSLTPFVGAGIGFSRNTIHSFMDINTPNAGVAFGDTASKWNFAWALHAGLGYKVTKNFTVELAYRYVSLGDALSGDIQTYTGVNNVYNPMEFHKLTSHDLKLGLRFNLDGFAETFSPRPQYYPQPVYQQPYQPQYQPHYQQQYQPQYQPQYQQPAYTPPPVYAPPPAVRSRG